jgi:hypothetical protein
VPPVRNDVVAGAHGRQELRREHAADDPDDRTERDAEQNRLCAGMGGGLRILFANAARDGCSGADRQADSGGVEDRHHRLGHTDRRDGIGAELADEEDVHTRNTDSISISRTIGTARSTTARPMGASV